MALTKYHTSVLGSGELTGIRSNDKALTSAELSRLDAEAMHRINGLIVSIGGATTGGELVQSWIAETASVPSYIVLMAEKIAAAEAWHRWEQYNLGVASRDDRDHRRDSERLMAEVKDMAKTLADGKVIVDDDGTVITLVGGDAGRGPVVGGPMVEGSYFDDQNYYDSRGRRYAPRHVDPFKEV